MESVFQVRRAEWKQGKERKRAKKEGKERGKEERREEEGREGPALNLSKMKSSEIFRLGCDHCDP